MTIENFLFLWTVLSIVTSAFTEAVKRFLDSLNIKYASNVVVLCVSAVISSIGTIVFYLCIKCPWNALNIICIFLMIAAVWLGSMLGYDKAKQTIVQILSLSGGGK